MATDKTDDARGASRLHAELDADDAAALLARRRNLVNQRADVLFEIGQIDRRLMRICKHEWKFEQIAGEGKTCVKCGARDYSDD